MHALSRVAGLMCSVPRSQNSHGNACENDECNTLHENAADCLQAQHLTKCGNPNDIQRQSGSKLERYIRILGPRGRQKAMCAVEQQRRAAVEKEVRFAKYHGNSDAQHRNEPLEIVNCLVLGLKHRGGGQIDAGNDQIEGVDEHKNESDTAIRRLLAGKFVPAALA